MFHIEVFFPYWTYNRPPVANAFLHGAYETPIVVFFKLYSDYVYSFCIHNELIKLLMPAFFNMVVQPTDYCASVSSHKLSADCFR